MANALALKDLAILISLSLYLILQQVIIPILLFFGVDFGRAFSSRSLQNAWQKDFLFAVINALFASAGIIRSLHHHCMCQMEFQIKSGQFLFGIPVNKPTYHLSAWYDFKLCAYGKNTTPIWPGRGSGMGKPLVISGFSVFTCFLGV